MRRIEEMRLVLQLACLTEDRDNSEHKAMLSLAKNLDKEANAQTTANMLLRDQPYTECTFRDGPPQSHSTKGDACKCAGSGGSMPVRIPPGGWWRLVDLVEDTRAVVE